ncbi:MAG: methylated-DNA--[protein]-cysteine S-methyltransferase [Bacillota bacterium]
MNTDGQYGSVFKMNLGWMAASWCEAGVCRVILPRESPELAWRELEQETGGRLLRGRAHPGLEAAVSAWEDGDDAGLRGLVLQAGVLGPSGFQRRALEAMARIPRGQVISYAGLARAAGNPRAARAAGGACRSNPVPLVIPCHRVIASSGDLGGFAGGRRALTLKTALLEREGVTVSGRRVPREFWGGSEEWP